MNSSSRSSKDSKSLESRLRARARRPANWGIRGILRSCERLEAHFANRKEYGQRSIAQRHLAKRDRPNCGQLCSDGHPCQAPVVAGRHPDTRAPILGKHCRKHGGWS